MSSERLQESEHSRSHSEPEHGFEKPTTRITETELDADHAAISEILSTRGNGEKRKTPPLLRVQSSDGSSSKRSRKVVHQEFSEELISSLPSIADMMQKSRGAERSRGAAIIFAGLACGGLLGGLLYLIMLAL